MICPMCLGVTVATYGIPIASGIFSGYVAAKIATRHFEVQKGRAGVGEREKNTMVVTYHSSNNKNK